MKTATKRTLDVLQRPLSDRSASELNSMLDEGIGSGLERVGGFTLGAIVDALDVAQAREKAAQQTAAVDESLALRVKRATVKAAENKMRLAGLAAAKNAPLPLIKVEIDGVTIAEIRAVPLLSMPEIFEIGDHAVSRAAVSVAFQSASNFAGTRVTDARARAMGSAPSRPEDIEALKRDLREQLTESIRRGLTKVI